MTDAGNALGILRFIAALPDGAIERAREYLRNARASQPMQNEVEQPHAMQHEAGEQHGDAGPHAMQNEVEQHVGVRELEREPEPEPATHPMILRVRAVLPGDVVERCSSADLLALAIQLSTADALRAVSSKRAPVENADSEVLRDRRPTITLKRSRDAAQDERA